MESGHECPSPPVYGTVAIPRPPGSSHRFANTEPHRSKVSGGLRAPGHLRPGQIAVAGPLDHRPLSRAPVSAGRSASLPNKRRKLAYKEEGRLAKGC